MTEFADRIPAPRPVPTTRHRLDDARSHAIEVERDDLRIQTGRLEADNRAMMRDRDQALAERDEARDALRDVLAELKDRTAELGAAQELAAFRQRVNDSLRQDLSDAGDVIAAVREAAERLDRALAGRLPSLPDIRAAVEHIDRALAAYDTTPESTAPPALGSPPPRAQDEPDSDARRLLDQAIAAALPLAGGRVTELLDALRRELVRVDAKRAEREG